MGKFTASSGLKVLLWCFLILLSTAQKLFSRTVIFFNFQCLEQSRAFKMIKINLKIT